MTAPIFGTAVDAPLPPPDAGAKALFFKAQEKLLPIYRGFGAVNELKKLFATLNDDALSAKEKLIAFGKQIDTNQRGAGFGFVELPAEDSFARSVSDATEEIAKKAVDDLKGYVQRGLLGVFLDP